MPEPLSWTEKQALIKTRAHLIGFRRRHELEDAVQEVSLCLLQFNYDAAKSNGACETTVLTTVIDRRLKHLKRSRRRYAGLVDRAIERLAADHPEDEDGPFANEQHGDERIALAEVAALVEGLPAELRDVAKRLMAGQTTAGIARELAISWKRADRLVMAIRQRLLAAGFESTDAK